MRERLTSILTARCAQGTRTPARPPERTTRNPRPSFSGNLAVGPSLSPIADILRLGVKMIPNLKQPTVSPRSTSEGGGIGRRRKPLVVRFQEQGWVTMNHPLQPTVSPRSTTYRLRRLSVGHGHQPRPLRPVSGRLPKRFSAGVRTPDNTRFYTFLQCTGKRGRRAEKPINQAISRVFWVVYRIGPDALANRRFRPLSHLSKTLVKKGY